MSKHLSSKPTPDCEAVEVTPFQHILNLLIMNMLPINTSLAYHAPSSKGAIIYTEYKLVTPENYNHALFMYILYIMKLLYSRGIQPNDISEVLGTIRMISEPNPHRPNSPILHFVCIPTFGIMPTTDDIMEKIKVFYQDVFAPVVEVTEIVETLEFVTTSFSGTVYKAWNILVTDFHVTRPRFRFMVPRVSGQLGLFVRKFKELMATSLFRTACFFMLVKSHGEAEYKITEAIVDEMLGTDTSTTRITNLQNVTDAVNVKCWRMLTESEADRFCNTIALYITEESDQADAFFTAIVEKTA